MQQRETGQSLACSRGSEATQKLLCSFTDITECCRKELLGAFEEEEDDCDGSGMLGEQMQALVLSIGSCL